MKARRMPRELPAAALLNCRLTLYSLQEQLGESRRGRAADAVLARDADRACALLAEHFEGTTRLILGSDGMARAGDSAKH